MSEKTQIAPMRSRVKEGLMLNDEQLLRKLGIPLERGRRILDALDRDRHAGFPRKQPMWEYRRYWPAVDKWLEHNSHLLQSERLSA
jgi:transcription initiation factor IIE alpha subunit